MEHLDTFGTRIQALTNPPAEVLMGKYEWLIHAKDVKNEMSNGATKTESNSTINDNEKEALWRFSYDWKHKAKECFE